MGERENKVPFRIISPDQFRQELVAEKAAEAEKRRQESKTKSKETPPIELRILHM